MNNYENYYSLSYDEILDKVIESHGGNRCGEV